jgi:hypothetical protein
VTDFPDPDSPTRPKVSPAAKVNEMDLTAGTTPDFVENVMERFRTSKMGAVIGTMLRD